MRTLTEASAASPPRAISTLLVANRGEIALRVMRSARALGLRTVAVYSEVDADAPHVSFADVAVPIGPASVSESYLSVPNLLAAARDTGADAVHPGYGLLSENAAFARACGQAGLTFVGPRPETIELMGDKRGARLAMQAAGVACVPGYDGDDQSDATLSREAERIGFPVMVKAAAGGGGRGMRRVAARADVFEAITRARSEAQKAFGDGRLILERAIDGARHVEIQILADAHGHVLHLGERDCSMQRRFQKVIEESPSPAVSTELRARMGAMAVLAARSSNYVGAGTVELLLGGEGAFYFLEMNTRLQVEHPVTELVTGIDLVQWQLRIAQGEVLPFAQGDVTLSGHAIEARVYAEVPERGFLPATGRVLSLDLPEAEGLRIDHGLAEGLGVTAHYDAMLAKVIAHGPTREQARARLCLALRQLRLLGVETNQDFLRALLEHERFVQGAVTTDFLDAHARSMQPAAPTPRLLAAAALVVLARQRQSAPYPEELADFTNCAALAWPLVLERADARHALRVEPSAQGELVVHAEGASVRARIERVEEGAVVALLDGLRSKIHYAVDGDRLWIKTDGVSTHFDDVTHAPPRLAHGQGSGRALAPMDGSVVDLPAQVGARVQRGQTLAVVEAMKLELRVSADKDGVVAAIHVARGQQVRARQLLVELRHDGGEAV